MTCIYKITNPIGEVYIGQTRNLNVRIRQHRSKNNQTGVGESIKQYGFNAHKVEVLRQLGNGCCLSALNFMEKYYIEKYRADGVKLLNKVKGGSGMSNDVRKKLSEVKSGIERHSFKGEGNPYYGKKHTKEELQKMSELGKVNKLGTKNGRARAVLQYDINGNLLREWGTVTEASNELKLNRAAISDNLNGRLRTSGGFIWKYKNNPFQ